MKAVAKTLAVILAVLFVCGSAGAGKKGRKLTVGAYLKTAKIEILSGEPERYKYAIAMLDSLFMHYGPHAEGLYLMGQIMVDGIETSSSFESKGTYLKAMVAYFDSLKTACANEKIKKGYRKGCKGYVTIADSLGVKYWRQFFNEGIRQLGNAQELRSSLEAETDSIIRSFTEKSIAAALDSSIENMKLSILAIADSVRPYLIIDKAYGLKGEYRSGIEWLEKGLDKSDNPATVQLSIAYDYVKMEDYCGAIPYYREYLASNPSDTANLLNLAICYNNCGILDSVLAVYQRILAIAPEKVGVITNVGRYYNTVARSAADSASRYQREGNDEMARVWSGKKQEAFDSARVYFRRAFKLNPDNVTIAEQYGLVSALLGDYEEATIGFSKLTELEPQQAGNWTSLGDCFLSLKRFEEAVSAYEKVVQLEPDNVSVWEHLKDLYVETGQKGKRAEAEKKLKELKR